MRVPHPTEDPSYEAVGELPDGSWGAVQGVLFGNYRLLHLDDDWTGYRDSW